MTKFVAQLNDCSFVNISADEMALNNACIEVYHKGKLVGFFDVSVILTAYISGKAVSQ